MHAGHVISGAGHIGLIGWLLFGGVFQSEPLPFQATDISVISTEDYEALVAAQQAPRSGTEVAQPEAPAVEDSAATPPPAETEVTPPPPPEVTQAPEPETVPEVPQPAPPVAAVEDTPPQQPSPPEDVAVLVPQVSNRPVPRPSERVAPEPVAPPPPEAQPDPVQQEAVTPEDIGETVQEPQEATAPEEAATEIVTEAEQPSSAPNASRRPPARPTPPLRTAVAEPAETPAPTPTPQPTPETPPATGSTRDAVDAALAEALGGATSDPEPTVATGQPLSAGEKDALRVAVSSCWNVGSLSSDALRTTVVVTVSMTPDARPVTSSIRMTGSSGGSDGAAAQAFDAARRAIIRCGARGFNLPSEKYGQWQEIEMTFNPERMRIK